MRHLGRWLVAGLAGLVSTSVAWGVLETLGHQPMMMAGLAVAAGVAGTALTDRLIKKQDETRERMAQLQDDNEP